MPMTCYLATAPHTPRRLAALIATSVALTLAVGGWPLPAQAQFTGNTSNDLTNPNSTDVGQVNDTPIDNGGNRANGTSGNGNGNGYGNGSGNAGGNGNNANANNGNVDANGNSSRQNQPTTRSNRDGTQGQPEPRLDIFSRPARPGEFEMYVLQLPGAYDVRRFGANLVTDDALATSATQDPLPSIPAEYIIRPGDEITLTVWGTVEADVQLTVDRAGRISVPHVGAVAVAGLRSADLADAISHRIGQTYKNFQLTATLGQVRAIRVFVSGYVQRPGSVTVSGLSSVLHAVMRAGGPSAAGSFRDIHLRRAGKEVAVFDLYDLLLKGDRDTDRLVQPDDVIFIGPVGTQVAVLGSVNQQAVYELRNEDTLGDLLKMAGGFTAVADRSRVSIEKLADRTSGRVAQLTLPQHAGDRLGTGDVIHVFSVVSATLPQGMQNEHVRVEGEVAHPGDYILPAGAHMADALRAAGGLTSAAYPYGTDFSRESVRKTQQVNYERALRDLETDISKNQANQRVTSAEELNTQAASTQASTRLLERLRQIRPTGRVILQLSPDATVLPDLPLEDGDTIKVPSRGTSVGVFGSVFNTGSFVFEPGHTSEQYLALAGGPTRGADKTSIFMIRANGSVISARQGASFWHGGNNLSTALVEPGDTLFVPEELNKATFIQDAKDWTQILYQFGLGLAGIKSLGL